MSPREKSSINVAKNIIDLDLAFAAFALTRNLPLQNHIIGSPRKL